MDNRARRNTLARGWDSPEQLEGMRLFVAVAQAKSFRAAARALKLPKSTVSRRVAQLEESLGIRLLQRTTRTVTPTAAGEALFSKAAPALQALGEAQRALVESQAEPRGSLKVTAPAGFAEQYLSGVITNFLLAYPQVALTVDLTDRHVDLVREGYDVALRVGALPDSSLIVRPLGAATSGIYASPKYLAERGAPRVPKDLLEHDCIIFSGSQRGGRWGFRVGRRLQEVAVRGRYVVNSMPLVRDAALRGMGIIWLPQALGEEDVKAGTLVPLLQEFLAPPVPMAVVYPSARNLSPAVRAFVEHLTQNVRPTGPAPRGGRAGSNEAR
jgi:DNA-binding transcriptional LysR family regulator